MVRWGRNERKDELQGMCGGKEIGQFVFENEKYIKVKPGRARWACVSLLWKGDSLYISNKEGKNDDLH